MSRILCHRDLTDNRCKYVSSAGFCTRDAIVIESDLACACYERQKEDDLDEVKDA